MRRDQTLERVEHRDLHRVIGWFITIRWVASVSVPLTLLIARFGFEFLLAYRALYTTTAALAAINLIHTLIYWKTPEKKWTRSRYTILFHAQILTDYLLLLLLVYFSGFLENPFIYFFVFHVMLTSFLFRPSIVWTYVMGLIVVIVAVAAAERIGVLPHFRFSGEDLAIYCSRIIPKSAGLCATLAISAYLVTNIRGRIEAKGRAVEIELNRYKNLDRIKSNFILQVTHELRGPIAAVSGFHEMILRGITGEVSPDTSKALQKAERRTDNLLTIIDEMIDYAYMRSEDELRYQLAELDLGRVVREIIESQAAHAVEKSIRLEPKTDENLAIVSNRDLLDILLGNLINNAIKYSPENTTIRVTGSGDGAEIVLEVSDQGYGIEADQLEKIFEEFYRTRQARELERDGTGLGLPIVKRAVESLGGRITVYSEVGNGTRFNIRLPVNGTASPSNGESDDKNPDH